VFYNAPVIVDNAIETPVSLEDKIHHKIIFWLNGNKESVVKSIINGKAAAFLFPIVRQLWIDYRYGYRCSIKIHSQFCSWSGPEGKLPVTGEYH